MIMHVYEADEFHGGPDSEQRILYFYAEKGRGRFPETFEEFTKACIRYELRLDYLSCGQPAAIKDLEKHADQLYLTQTALLSPEDFLQNRELSGFNFRGCLIEHTMVFPAVIQRCVALYPQEWNYLFHVAESATGFYGYNWFTSA